MMEQIKKYAPRKDKNGWRLQKFHDLLHVVRDIENFGSPNNIDAAPNENNLIDFAKRPGRRAHKKREVFVSQVSKRLRESDLIRKAHYAIKRFIESKDMDWDHDDEQLEFIQEQYGYDEDSGPNMENGSDNNIVTSFLPVRALFTVNL